MAIPLLAASALTALPKALLGAYQTYQSTKALKELSKEEYPEFQISPELQGAYSRAQEMSKRGFSAEEQADFQQRMGRQQAGAFRQATEMGGGNLARAISAGLGAQNIGAVNQFAAQGAQLKRQNIRYADDLARALQTQKNMATQQKIARRQQLEQAYGWALQAGLSNIAGSISGVGSMFLGETLGKKINGSGQAGTTGADVDLISSGKYAGQPQSTPPTEMPFDWEEE